MLLTNLSFNQGSKFSLTDFLYFSSRWKKILSYFSSLLLWGLAALCQTQFFPMTCWTCFSYFGRLQLWAIARCRTPSYVTTVSLTKRIPNSLPRLPRWSTTRNAKIAQNSASTLSTRRNAKSVTRYCVRLVRAFFVILNKSRVKICRQIQCLLYDRIRCQNFSVKFDF